MYNLSDLSEISDTSDRSDRLYGQSLSNAKSRICYCNNIKGITFVTAMSYIVYEHDGRLQFLVYFSICFCSVLLDNCIIRTSS